VLLLPAKVVALCGAPANAAAIAEGRRLERRHRLHIEGKQDLLMEFFSDYRDVMDPQSLKNIQKVAVPATKTKFGTYRDVLGKVFTARDTTTYFEFANPRLGEEFEAYLEKIKFLPQLRKRFQRASLTGFQGVFLVDLPAEPNAPDELPAPVVKYISSALIHDAKLTADTYEYLIIKQVVKDEAGKETTFYVCFDDDFAHVVTPGDGGKLLYSEERTTRHGLGYVPAFPPSLFVAQDANDTTRTSIFDKALPVADVYLRDHAEHELSKKYHAFPQKWSYTIRCEHSHSVRRIPEGCGAEAAFYDTASCAGTGWLRYQSGEVVKCSNCTGTGRVVPVGTDKTYLLDTPTSRDNPDIRPPAGYIVPDNETLTKQADELETQERQLEQAALGKEGVLGTTTKVETAQGKELDLQPVYDRCREYGGTWQQLLQLCYDTMARLRHDVDFIKSSVVIGDKYTLKSVSQLEKEYKDAKDSGMDDSVLFGYLEEIIYSRYATDPLELEFNLLKLHLTPIPTRSTKELSDMIQSMTVQPPKLLVALERKLNLNDYVARFERENGPLVQFGVRRSFAERIATINSTFNTYDNERVELPA
jgi:hypothetical protein